MLLENPKTAFLISTYQSSQDKKVCEESLEELSRLAETAGLQTIEKVPCHLRKIEAGTFLGKGKLEELVYQSQALNTDIVIFDDEITPHQQRNLENLFKTTVIDRTELIIEVFAQRAQTKEARLQIELASAKYQLPRLKRLWTHLSRQSVGGKGYLKGEGEKQIEIDRRLIRRRIDQLNDEIKEVIAQRSVQRSQRLRSGIPTFAIVGYTNAGKSTLLRALTKADVLVEDKLFATLDTTTRKYFLPNRQEVLLIDTVGFIRKLPHDLVLAFKSTLEEALYTDVLIHLIDVSHPAAESQAESAMQVLKELGALDRPIITVLNKIDQCSQPNLLQRFRVKYPKTIAISALEGKGFDQLTEMMMEELKAMRKTFNLRIPQSHYALVSELMREARVFSCVYDENDIVLEVEIPKRLEYKVIPFSKI